MAFQYFPRNYDGRNHSGWNPSPTGYDSDGGVSRRRHHPKHHVAFKAEEQEIISRNNSSSNIVVPQENVDVYNKDPVNAPNRSVDDEADAFIKHEHSRIQLARLRSINPY